MSAPANIFIPDDQTERLFRNIAEATKQSVPELLESVMGLWVADLVRQTYPKTRKQTAGRIAAETANLFLSIKDTESESIKRSFEDGNVFELPNGIQVRPQETADDMTAARNRVRNRRGRVPKFPGVMRKIVKDAPLRRHIRAAQKHVGRLKGGWRRAAEWARVNVPSWVPRGMESGEFADTIDRETLYGHLEAGNTVPYADATLRGSFMDFIMRKRFTDLTSGKYAMRWQRKMQRGVKP